MGCTKKYTNFDRNIVSRWARNFKEDKDALHDKLIESFIEGDAIFKAIQDGSFKKDPSWIPITKLEPVTIDLNKLPWKTTESELLDVRSAYISSRGRDFKGFISKFTKKLITLCVVKPSNILAGSKLYDSANIEKDGVSTMNHNIFNYKIELLRTLLKVVGNDIDINFKNISDIDFTQVLVKILQNYEYLKDNKYEENKEKIDNSLDAYMTLKWFDRLIEDYNDFIKIKPIFKNGTQEGLDMYEFVDKFIGNNTSYLDESADLEKFSSPIVKLLLEYFTETEETNINGERKYVKTDRSIGFSGFANSLNKFFEWVTQTQNNDKDAKDAIYSNDNVILDENGESKLSKLLDRYLNESQDINYVDRNRLNGIKEQIFKCKDQRIINLLWKLANNSVILNYANYKYKYRWEHKRKEVSFVSIRSELYERRKQEIQKSVQHAIYNWNKDSEAKKALQQTYEISVKYDDETHEKGTISIGNLISVTFSTEDKRYKFGYTSNMSDANFRKLCEDVLQIAIEYNQEDFKTLKSTTGVEVNGITKVYDNILFTALLAMNNGNFKTYYNEINLYSYYGDYDLAGRLWSIRYGFLENTVAKNAQNYNIPLIQVGTSIYCIDEKIWNAKNSMEHIRSVIKNREKSDWFYRFNVLYRTGTNKNQKSPIAAIYNRGDIKIEDTVKNATKLKEKELAQIMILNDFYKTFREHSSQVLLQPTDYADRKTQYSILFNVDAMDVKTNSSASLATIINGIMNEDKKSEIDMRNEIKYYRAHKTWAQIYNLFSKYKLMFNEVAEFKENFKEIDQPSENSIEMDEINVANVLSNITLIETVLSKESEEDLFKLAKRTGVTLTPALDYVKLKNDSIRINETLKNNVSLYLTKNSETAFNPEYTNRINRERLHFIKNLYKCDFRIDANIDNGLNDIINRYTRWSNPTLGIMNLAEVFDKNGTKLDITDDKIDELFSGKYKVVINPILNSYFYTHMYLANSFNDLFFGDVMGIETKYGKTPGTISNDGVISGDPTLSDLKTWHDTGKLDDDAYHNALDNFYLNNEASRTIAQLKRTVFAGSTKYRFQQGRTFGVTEKAKIACIEDPTPEVQNIMGWSKNTEALDGVGLSNPYYSRMVNDSLLDSAGGSNKKTIYDYVDPETGCLTLLKWAEYEITNQARRYSWNSKTFKMENAFKQSVNFNIPISVFNNFNISRFWNNTATTYMSEHSDSVNHIISNNKSIYKYDNETGKHWRLVSLQSNNNKVIAQWLECNSNGSMKAGTKTIETTIKTLYDLDEVFGGAFCETYNPESKKLDWAETNNDIVYNIICELGLKNYLIAYCVLHSAIKVGYSNPNTVNVFSDKAHNQQEDSISKYAGSLWYTEISTKYGGIQMNPDKDIDENMKVSEQSQLMFSLMQEGLEAKKALSLYDKIGKLVYNNLFKYENKSGDKIYAILGKALIQSYNSGSKSVMGLAQSFIANANKGLESGDYSIRIPFSANSIKGSFEAITTSLLNNKVIKRKFAGVGNLSNPSYGIMQVYEIGDKVGTYMDINKFLITDRAIRQGTWKISDLFNYEKILTADNTIIDNPYIVPIEINKLKMGDTIVVGHIVNKWQSFETVTLDTFQKYDLYKNVYGRRPEYSIKKWTIAPRELSQTWITFNAGGKEYSLYDLDETRALFYLNLIKKLDAKDPLYSYYKNHILSTLRKYDKNINDSADLTNPNYSRFLKSKQQLILNQLNDIKNGKKTILGIQNIIVNDPHEVTDWNKLIIDNVKVIPAQIITGRLNNKALGIDKSSIYEIESNSDYFRNLVESAASRVSDYNVDSDLYDAILSGRDGKKTLVIINSDKTQDIIDKNFTVNTNYRKMPDGIIYYNNKEFCNINTDSKEFRQYVSNGIIYDVVIVDSKNDIDDLLKTDAYELIRYNYNSRNWQDLVKLNFKKDLVNFDNIQVLDEAGKKRNLRSLFALDSEYRLIDIAEDPKHLNIILKYLNTNETSRIANRLDILARNRKVAWEASLQNEITRIPSQSLQSTIKTQVVGYSDNAISSNDSFIPLQVMAIMGADLDADENWHLTFEFDKNGKLATLSNLDKEYNAIEVLKLPVPQHRVFEIKPKGVLIESILSSTELNALYIDIKTIKKLLENKNTVYSTVKYESKLKQLINKLNIHESTERSANIAEMGMKNMIVSNLFDITGSISTISKITNPISMDAAESAADKSVLGKSERYMTSDDPSTLFTMQTQNMEGKQVISIGASSLKTYFELLTYYNKTILDIVDGINNKTISANEIANKLLDISFINPFTNKLGTLPNCNFSLLINALQDNNISELKLESIKKFGKFDSYITDASNLLNIKELVNQLNEESNGNGIDKIIDAGDTFSCIITMATDNAKELKLAKLNCISSTANIYTSCAMMGMSIKEIADFMTSPAVNLVMRFTEPNIFEEKTKWFNFSDAIEFVLNNKQLSNFKEWTFIKFLTNTSNGFSVIAQMFSNNASWSTSNDPIIKELLKLDPNIKNKSVSEVVQYYTSELFLPTKKDLLNTVFYPLFKNKNFIDLLKKNLLYLIINLKTAQVETTFNDEYDITLEENRGEDEPTFSKTLTLEEAQSLYSYITNYVEKRNNLLKNIYPEDINKIRKIRNFFPAIEEYKTLASILSINQGIETSSFGEYNKIKSFEKYINTKYYNAGIEERFDFIKFLTDDTYKERQMKLYDSVKINNNILKAIEASPNFWQMTRSLAVNRKLIESSAALKIEHQLPEILLSWRTAKKGEISLGDTKSLNNQEYLEMQRYISDSIINYWVTHSSLMVNKIRGNNVFGSIGITKWDSDTQTVPIESQKEIATFKIGMENYIIPKLKAVLSDNLFIKRLLSTSTYDKVSSELAITKRLPISLMDSDRTANTKLFYNETLDDFNKISKETIGTINKQFDANIEELCPGLTIGDMFYLYNLIVYKDGFGTNSLTRIFEDLNNSSNFALIFAFNSFLSELDKDSDSFDISFDPITGIAHYGDIEFNLLDYYQRICINSNAYNKFGIKTTYSNPSAEDKNKKAVTEISLANDNKSLHLDTISVKLEQIEDKPTYFPLNLPFLLNSKGTRLNGNRFDRMLHRNIKRTYNLNGHDSEISEAIVSRIRDLYGIPVSMVNREILTEMYNRRSDPKPGDVLFKDEDDFNTTLNSYSFLHNGVLYINDQSGVQNKNLADAPLHELLHIACAAMKFSRSKELKDTYYKMLDDFWELEKLNNNSFYKNEIKQAKTNKNQIITSDMKEEALVRALAYQLSNKFGELVEENADKLHDTALGDLYSFIGDVITKILNTDTNVTSELLQKYSNQSITDALAIFKSKLIDLNRSMTLSSYLPWNQKIEQIKEELIKNGKLTFENCF